MKKNKFQDQFLDELRKIPIVQVACEKTNLSRNTVYRWRREDEAFAESMDTAMADGIAFISDMSESQLLNLIKDKHYSAIRLWLTTHHPAYGNKVRVDHQHVVKSELNEEELTTIQQALVMLGGQDTSRV